MFHAIGMEQQWEMTDIYIYINIVLTIDCIGDQGEDGPDHGASGELDQAGAKGRQTQVVNELYA